MQGPEAAGLHLALFKQPTLSATDWCALLPMKLQASSFCSHDKVQAHVCCIALVDVPACALILPSCTKIECHDGSV